MKKERKKKVDTEERGQKNVENTEITNVVTFDSEGEMLVFDPRGKRKDN